MQPSSLIFLVLIAIWAAYLLQHWVRRREHLATARSVDRFSEAMRVLERRTALPELDLSAPRPRSYSVSPARPSRPEVVVKRAQPLRPKAPTGPVVAVRSTRVFHALAGVSARRVRGLSLLASLLLVLVVWPLAAFSVLPWWSALVVVPVLVADLAWLRHVARSAAASRLAENRFGPEVRFEPGAELGSSAETESTREPGPAPGFEPERVTDPPLSGAAAVAGPVEAVDSPEPTDDEVYGWAPVPVPPPTYTLKAKAAEPVVVPVEVAELAPEASWSLDGMVYDCELDELVERRSATGT